MRDLVQFAVKQETSPGVAETLAAADVLVRVREGDAPDIGVDFLDTQEVQQYSSNRPSKPGIRRFQGSASWVLRPSGTPASVAPACGKILQMGMLLEEQVKQVTIGAVTGGPFLDGETIVGASSGGQGRVFRPTSATPLRYTQIGAIALQNGERVDGQTSGAYATTGSIPSNQGFLYRLTDSDFVGVSDSKHHCTCEFLRGGYYWKGRGVLGELAFEFKNMAHAIVKTALLGALEATGDKAMYAVSSYPDETVTEPRFVGAGVLLDSYGPTDIIDFNLSIPLGLELREDAQNATGLLFTDYERRGSPPIVTLEPAMVTAATYDFFTKHADGTTFAMSWNLGAKFSFYADECQFVTVGVGNRRSLATVPLQIRLCGTTNNELEIWARP